jgi:hypothetical protein
VDRLFADLTLHSSVLKPAATKMNIAKERKQEITQI